MEGEGDDTLDGQAEQSSGSGSGGQGELYIEAYPIAVMESDGYAVFTVSLSGMPSQPVSVDVTTTDGTAFSGDDYLSLPLQTLTFTPTQLSHDVSVPIIDDPLSTEDTQSFYLQLLNPVGASVDPSNALVEAAIHDDPFVAPSLGISHKGNDITGQTINVSVGERVTLTLLGKPSGAQSQYAIQHKHVKSYTLTSSGASYENLAASDLDDTSVSFYWISGGQKTIANTVTVRGVGTTVYATADVYAPSGTITSTTTSMTPAIGYRDSRLSFGDSEVNDGEGINIDGTVTGAANGHVAFVQLVSSVEVWDNLLIPIIPSVAATGGYVLDDGEGLFYDKSVSPAATKSVNLPDSPRSPVPALADDYFTRNDKFKVYLMYRPDLNDAIWVTLARMKWDWKGKLVDSGSTWSIDGTYSQYTVDPTGAASTELPVFDDTYNNTMNP